MSNAFKEAQAKAAEESHKKLVEECRATRQSRGTVAAIRQYRAATNSSLQTAQRILEPKS